MGFLSLNWKWVVGAAIFGVVVVQFLPSMPTSQGSAVASTAPSIQPTKTPAVAGSTPPAVATERDNPATPERASNWNYSEDADQMRGTVTKVAMIESTNELGFDFPYHTGNAILLLRKRPEDGLNVILKVDGQFTCNSFNDGFVSVKFDNDPIKKFSCTEPADGSIGTLFIQGERRFVERLRKAKSVTIEAEFFQAGRRQMRFDVGGLKWG